MERPVQRSFSTQSGGCCCKSSTNVCLKGRVLNTNIKSYSDELKFNCVIDMNKRSGNLQQVVVMTCFGVTPIDRPKPDLTVWKALSTYRYFPSKDVKNEEFDTSKNDAYIQTQGGDDARQMGLHYVSNTVRIKGKKIALISHSLGINSHLFSTQKLKSGDKQVWELSTQGTANIKRCMLLKFIQ